MKPIHAPFPLYQPQKAAGRLSHRGAALLLLAIPLFLTVVCLLLAVIITAGGGHIEDGSLRQYTAAFGYTGILVSVIVLPSYCVALVWYWWRTRGVADMRRLAAQMWLLPPIGAAFIWFPSLLFPAITDKFQAYLTLAGAALVLGYLWVAFARFLLILWRKL